MSNDEPLINDELEVAEAKHPLVDVLYDYTARVVMSRPGHYIYNKFDACLAIVEKTARWSLPQPSPSEEDTNKTTISAPPLIRPLPWILFLPFLIVLRMARCSLSLIALVIGKQPVDAKVMVYSLQNFRRKLRAFKYRGLKLKRIQRAEKETEPKPRTRPKQANTWLRRITFPLRYMLSLVGIGSEIKTNHRDHYHHHHAHNHRHHAKRPSEQPREVSQEPAKNGSQRAEPNDFGKNRKRNAHERDAGDSDSSFEEATVQELLEKYANVEADSSYDPSNNLSSDSDSDIYESDKSHSDTTEGAEKNDPKKIKKERNGHAATNGNEPKSEVEKPKESEQKSSLNSNANDGKTEENPGNGDAASGSQQKEEKPTEVPSKSVGAENESKPQNQSKAPPQDISSKNDNQNSSSKQSPTATKETKHNHHQKTKPQQQHQLQLHIQPTQQQQHQQQHHQQQPHQQQQQQQHTAINGGGGGRKHKKPHYPNTQHN